MSPLMTGLSGSVDVFWRDVEYGFSTVEVGAILGNGCRIQGQNYVALLHGCEVTAGFHCKDWILGIKRFRLIAINMY